MKWDKGRDGDDFQHCRTALCRAGKVTHKTTRMHGTPIYLYLDAWQDVIEKPSDEEAKRLSLAARYIIATYD